MNRYFINFKKDGHSVWFDLPMEGKRVIPIYHEDTVEIVFTPDMIWVDAGEQFLNIALTQDQYLELKNLGYRIQPETPSDPKALADYNNWVEWVTNPDRLYPNFPVRQEKIQGAIVTHNKNYFALTIQGEVTDSSYFEMGLHKLDARGFTGENEKVGVIDSGFMEPNYGHVDLTVTGNDGLSPWTDQHAIQMMSMINAYRNGFGIVGYAPKALVYAGFFYNTAQSIEYMLGQDVKVINASFETYPDSYMKMKIKKARLRGVTFNVAAGNTSSLQDIQPLAVAPFTTVVGSLVGGGTQLYTGAYRYNSRRPVLNKKVDFFIPYNSIAAQKPDPDTPWTGISSEYGYSGGTSTSNAKKSGIELRICQMYPDMPGNVRDELLKIHSTQVGDGYSPKF